MTVYMMKTGVNYHQLIFLQKTCDRKIRTVVCFVLPHPFCAVNVQDVCDRQLLILRGSMQRFSPLISFPIFGMSFVYMFLPVDHSIFSPVPIAFNKSSIKFSKPTIMIMCPKNFKQSPSRYTCAFCFRLPLNCLLVIINFLAIFIQECLLRRNHC